MIKKLIKNERFLKISYLVLSAFLILAFCSKSSFLYPFNNWDDANCFFTVGKSMFNGLVVYKDIYEQKGVLLYFIYGLASLISKRSFIGAFFFEVVFASVYVYFLYRIIALFVKDKEVALVLSPAVLFLSFASKPFYFGGSAEEFCLPFLAIPVFFLLEYLKGEREERMSWKKILISGICAGCVFWIKYTILGLFFAWAIFAVVAYILRKDYSGIFISVGIFLGGVVIASFPWIAYFGINGALDDFYTAYIYNNIFLYGSSATAGQVLLRLINIFFVRFIKDGIIFSVPAVVGVLYAFFKDIKNLNLASFFIPAAFLFEYFFIYMGGMVGVYYSLPLSFFSVFAVVAVINGVEYFSKNCEAVARLKKYIALFGAATVVLTSVCSLIFTPNRANIGYDKDGLFAFEFERIISQKEDATLLNYGCLDLGVYTVTGIVPTCKYFCGLNISLEELYAMQREFIEEKKVDFVVCEISAPDFLTENYVLLAEGVKKFDDSENPVFLYGLKE